MPKSSIEWIDEDIIFPTFAPACFRGRAIKVGWQTDLKRIVVNFQGLSPSAAEVAWAEEYISVMAESLGIDPSTRYRFPSQGTN